jgi:adenylate cyclase class 2
MIVSTEYEAKALNIDPDAIGVRILAAGGRHVADRFMRRHVYEIPGYPARWIGLGETGTETTLCVTQVLSDASGGVREVELEVTDLEAAGAFLEMLGFTPRPTRRTSARPGS